MTRLAGLALMLFACTAGCALAAGLGHWREAWAATVLAVLAALTWPGDGEWRSGVVAR